MENGWKWSIYRWISHEYLPFMEGFSMSMLNNQMVIQLFCFVFFIFLLEMIGIYWNALWETTVSDPVLLFPGRSGSGNFMIFESVAFAKAWAFQRLSKECLRAVLESQGRWPTHRPHHHPASLVAGPWFSSGQFVKASHRPNAFNPASECCDARVLDGFGQVTIDVFFWMFWFQMVSDFSDEDGSCIVWG